MGTYPSSFPTAYKLVFFLFMLCSIRLMILSANPTIPFVAMIHEWGMISQNIYIAKLLGKKDKIKHGLVGLQEGLLLVVQPGHA